MTDPHLNIFHAYRGPSASDVARDRQLEDNLTRALAITLQSVRATPAQAPLLQLLGVPNAQLDEPFQCRLQVDEDDSSWPRAHERQLLVLHGGSAIAITDETEDTLRGRADAVIWNPRFMLAIESKLGAHVTQTQLERHRATLGIGETSFRTLTWTRLARTVRAISDDVRVSAVARFVLEQFEEYLSMNGFGGLIEEHLSYFARQPEHRDDFVKEGIRRALEGLMPELAQAWQSDWRQTIGNIRQTDRSAWAKLEPARSEQAPHLSLSIDPAGLDLFANIETRGPYDRFRTAFQKEPEGLIALIRQLGSAWPPGSIADPPWRFRVVRRIETRPRTFNHWPAVDIAATALSDFVDDHMRWFIDEVTRRPAEEAVPEIMLVLTLPATVILGEVRLAERLATHATELEPFFAWLSEPIR